MTSELTTNSSKKHPTLSFTTAHYSSHPNVALSPLVLMKAHKTKLQLVWLTKMNLILLLLILLCLITASEATAQIA